ncbi:MAG TPA: sialidase family protein [Sedimentisphaerales bacterium]|nr:sialidase family protein [Sedimentisphaerales bacterium]HRS11660.1 sialidase family protein [Sedimentisphaerales bacterium]HRV48323.1 sialidase family protein [Sedimentisphaerales bacterium]
MANVIFRITVALALLLLPAAGKGAAPALPKSYSIPVVDLSGETQRQTVVDREAGQYLGHPTTVLLEDNRTILAVYPKGHGRGAIVMKRSADAGLTWSDRLPTPENWATSQETPTIHRVVDHEGRKRLILFSGLYPIRMAVSENDGHNWTALEPIGDFGGIVAMASVERLANGDYMALFHDDGRFLRNEGKVTRFRVYKTLSQDGGLTWGQPTVIAEHPEAHLCEPGLIRSPDGRQIAVLLRENSRKFNSFVIFSDDEGQTWSEPRELPAALTGDRHVGKYAPDGRLFVTFRDTTHISPTKGDWVGWVGTYDDIVEGREGQYRVRLMDNTKGADCAYPGLELLPDDGTFITTTYGHWTRDEQPYIVSVRLKLSELDQRAAERKVALTDLYVAGNDGYHTYRIPSLLVTGKGTLLAFCEGRKSGRGDSGNIDLLVRRSEDGGRTWGPQRVVWDDADNTCGNPCPVVDQQTGTIWLTMTWNHGQDTESQIMQNTGRDTRRVFVTYSEDDGRTWSAPRQITETTKRPEWRWYATGPGVGIQLERGPWRGRLLIPCDHSVVCPEDPTGYNSHVIFSDDHGRTWQLGGAIRPAVNECQVVELADGTLLMNMRNYDRSVTTRAVATSRDGGMTWSQVRHDPALVEPICQASLVRYDGPQEQDRDCLLFSNPAHGESGVRRDMTVRLSRDGGRTWPVERLVWPGPAAYSSLAVLPDGAIACLFEGGQASPYERIILARFDRRWLTGELPGP